MFIKLLFVGLIISSGMAMGSVIISERRGRIDKLFLLMQGVRTVETSMLSHMKKVTEAFESGEKASRLRIFETASRLLLDQPSASGEEIFESLEKEEGLLSAFGDEEKDALKDFLKRVFGAISSEQIGDAAAIFKDRTERLYQALASEHKQKEKTIKALCLCASIALSIILI